MDDFSIVLTPEGYARVDELQKYSDNGRTVLVAMSFKDTQKLRKAIRKGIEDAGYYAIFTHSQAKQIAEKLKQLPLLAKKLK